MSEDRDVSPSKNSFPSKKKGESFNDAMNEPNDPQKRYQPTSWNPNADYGCDPDKDGDDD